MLIVMLAMWFVLINMQIDELMEVRDVKFISVMTSLKSV